jgi:signal transduction histidine kinase
MTTDRDTRDPASRTRSPDGRAPRRRDVGAVLTARLSMLAVCLGLLSLDDSAARHAGQIIALVVVVVAFSLVPAFTDRLLPHVAIAEGVAAGAVIATVSPLQQLLLPYLLAPALAAGLWGGVRFALLGAAAPASVLMLGRIAHETPEDAAEYGDAVFLWIVLVLATALLGAWVRRIEDQAVAESQTYEAARLLLTRLRDVARVLPSGLDEVTVAEAVLDEIRDAVAHDRAVVAAVEDGRRAVPLARIGPDAQGLAADLVPGSVWQLALNGSAVFAKPGDDDPMGHLLVVPVAVNSRICALIGLERRSTAFERIDAAAVQRIADRAAASLETALLFGEIRTMATVQERRRLAREIHDGIAQELASLGYLVDELAERPADAPPAPADLCAVRDEISRVVSELRLSIFDLRSEVRADTGIGEALSAYVRSVGAGSGLVVHLVLDESGGRLRVEAEAELLRIAQEAITNARRHSGAQNLWITCRVDPPHALLRIEDDGCGLRTRRDESYGIDIMTERSARIGGTLSITPRPGGGTVVEVVVGHRKSGFISEPASALPAELVGSEVDDGAHRAAGR